MLKPEISIIMPIYKAEKYLETCIESILNQSFSNFELILVDDGSPDACPEICDDYAKRDSRVIVIHQKNAGVSAARNAGIRIARGQYLMFCDSDDEVEPFWCERLYKAIKGNPNSWIVSNIWKFDEYGEKYAYEQTDGINLSYLDIYKMGLSAYLCNKIYTNRIVSDNEIFLDENCSFGEDVDFNVKYYQHCSGIVYIDTPLYFYNYNPAGLMNTQKNNWMELHLPLFYKRIPCIDQQEIPEFCDIWLYRFVKMLDAVYKEHNKSFLQKIRYNQKMVNSKEFRYCLSHASGKKENGFFIKVLNTHNYYLIYIFNVLVKLKQKMKGM